MSKAELSSAIRRERKRRRLKSDKCLSCGATEISTLQTVTLCAGCRLFIQSGAFSEQHNLIGGGIHLSLSLSRRTCMLS